MIEKGLELITQLMTAISNCTLYSVEHPAVLLMADKAEKTLESLYQEEAFSMAIYGDTMMMNDKQVTIKSLHLKSFMKKMRRKGIDKIVIKKGVKATELKDFIAEIALSSKISNTFPHISFGVIEVRLGEKTGINASEAMAQNISAVKDVYQDVSRFKPLDIVSLEDVVVNFISTLKQESNVLQVLSPVKSYHGQTYAHAANVSVLSIFQAEQLGVKKDIIHDIGLAGLLHDVGKMFIAKEIMDKEAKLSSGEWADMQKHPERGAMYLATLPDIPKYALIAAYEHHMKFNGKGYPDTKRKVRKQHIISQIVAIADFFDALRTERPHRKAFAIPVILGMMTESTGTDFNPMLVENFTRAVKKAGVA